MAQEMDDFKRLKAQQRFLDEIEQGVRVANREIIHGRIPEMNRELFLEFAVSVGRLRARYLEAAIAMATREHGDPPDQAEIRQLREMRENFQEGVEAFDALKDAIERGYVDVKS